MAITYTWRAKKLKSNDFDEAATLFLVLKGVEGDNSAEASASISFGGDDLRPMDDWTQAEIDAKASEEEPDLQAIIQSRLA